MRPHVLSDEDVTEEMMKRTWLPLDPPKKVDEKRAPGTYRESLMLACKEHQGQ